MNKILDNYFILKPVRAISNLPNANDTIKSVCYVCNENDYYINVNNSWVKLSEYQS